MSEFIWAMVPLLFVAEVAGWRRETWGFNTSGESTAKLGEPSMQGVGEMGTAEAPFTLMEPAARPTLCLARANRHQELSTTASTDTRQQGSTEVTIEDEQKQNSPYKMASTTYYPMTQMIAERAIRDVTNAEGSVADLIWIMDSVLVELIHRYSAPDRCIDMLRYECSIMERMMRSKLGIKEPEQADEVREEPKPTTDEVGTA